MGLHSVFAYIDQFGTDRVAGLVDIDMTPRTVDEEGWEHSVGGGNSDPSAVLGSLQMILANRKGFADVFIPLLFAAGANVDLATIARFTDDSMSVSDPAALALFLSLQGSDRRV